MSAEKIIYSILSGHAALTAIVGARIYPLVIPESAALPAVTYDVVGQSEHRTLANPAAGGLVSAQVRVTAAVAPNAYATLTAIMAALRDALDGHTDTTIAAMEHVVVHPGAETADQYDNELQIASRSRTLRLTFNTP